MMQSNFKSMAHPVRLGLQSLPDGRNIGVREFRFLPAALPSDSEPANGIIGNDSAAHSLPAHDREDLEFEQCGIVRRSLRSPRHVIDAQAVRHILRSSNVVLGKVFQETVPSITRAPDCIGILVSPRQIFRYPRSPRIALRTALSFLKRILSAHGRSLSRLGSDTMTEPSGLAAPLAGGILELQIPKGAVFVSVKRGHWVPFTPTRSDKQSQANIILSS